MENYKIKVNDLEDSEKLKVLDDLVLIGYQKHTKDWVPREIQNCGHFIAYAPPYHIEWDRVEAWGYDDDLPELTLPQLRDLVVLHRNDVKDATHVDQHGTKHVDLSGQWYWFHEQFTPDIPFGWVESVGSRDYDNSVLKPIQEQGLISGADALRALADGQLVQWMTGDEFQDVTDEWQIREFSHPSFKFRLKPRTIKLELEIPVCGSNPKQGQTLWILNSHLPNEYDSIVLEAAFDEPAYWWESEEDIKQVVAALRGIKG